MKYLFLTFCLFFNIISAQDIIPPKKFYAKVIGISDGDTFKVLYKKQEFRIRLNHIDAPEKSQNFGKKAKEYASNLCFGKNVRITWKKKDRYQRILGEVFLNEININQEMVKAGYAWHFKQYSKDPIYANLEIQAKKNKRGLWQDKYPIAPWDWRKNKKSSSKK